MADVLSLVDELSAVGRAAVAAGLVVASGGNLSARLPGGDACVITAAGAWLDRLSTSDFVGVRIADGKPFDALTPGSEAATVSNVDVRPSSEVALHLATYRVRPDVNAIVHLHPQVAVLLDALDEPIRLVTTDHAFYLRRVGRVPFHPPGSAELAQAAAEAAADGTNCVILAHHGCSALGADVAMAHRRASNLDEAARLTYRALVLTGGLPGRVLPDCPWELPSEGLI